MTSDNKKATDHEGFTTPSIFVDLIATFVGLALVYGMIALVGNGKHAHQAIGLEKKNRKEKLFANLWFSFVGLM